MRTVAVIAALFIAALLIAGCQELPPGVLAERRSPAAEPVDVRLARIEKTLGLAERAKDELVNNPLSAGDQSLEAENARLRAEIAALNSRLADAERLLAEEFGRRAGQREKVAARSAETVIR